jgi:anti-sigma B factor antagonist
VEGNAPQVVVLDLSGLSFLDSSGLRCLVRADERAKEASRRLVLVRGPDAVQKVFEITRLEERLHIVDDASELGDSPSRGAGGDA